MGLVAVALSMHCRSCRSSTTDKELVVVHEWQLTIDLSAVQSMAIAARFVLWTDEPKKGAG